MKNSIRYIVLATLLLAACHKQKNDDSTALPDGLTRKTETANGITFRVITKDGNNQYKGILVMGSGNVEDNPEPGTLDGPAENDLCIKAAQNGYVAAIVAYRKTAGTADWNTSAAQICEDYDKCITALSTEFGVDKSRSVVGGESYTSYMLLTGTAYYTTLAYCKGVLAPCGSTGQYQAEHFKIPIYSIVCSGNNEGDLAGKALYDAIIDPAIKSKSEGVTDNSCDVHCGNEWTDQLYNKLAYWLQ